jgi:hypothetical protein
VTIKAAAVCALVMLSTPAAAQGWGSYGPIFDHQEIRASLRAEGLRPISQPVLSGRYVVIRAVDRYGEPVRVLMSARYGDVIEVTRLSQRPVVRAYEPRPFRPYVVYPDRRYAPLERRAARPDLMYEPEDSPPPRAGEFPPNGRAAPPTAPSRTAALTPNRTPTPRPRPAAAGTTAAVTPAPAATETRPLPASRGSKPAPAATAAKPAPESAPKQAASPESKPSPAAAAAALSTPDASATGSTPPPRDGRHSFPPAATLE